MIRDVIVNIKKYEGGLVKHVFTFIAIPIAIDTNNGIMNKGMLNIRVLDHTKILKYVVHLKIVKESITAPTGERQAKRLSQSTSLGGGIVNFNMTLIGSLIP